MERDELLTSSYIRLRVVGSNGLLLRICLQPNTNIKEVKALIHRCFYNNYLGSPLHGFGLIDITKKRPLCDEKSLREEGLNNDDWIMYAPLILPGIGDTDIKPDVDYKLPSVESIADATKHLPSRNTDRPVPKFNSEADFKRDLRRILVTFIDFAEVLLREEEQIKEIFSNLDEFMRPGEDKDNLGVGVADQEITQQLLEMGFSHEKVRKAIKVTKLTQMDAMDWLLAFETQDARTIRSCEARREKVTLRVKEKVTEEKGGRFLGQSQLYPRVPALINCHRHFRRQSFKINPKSLTNMQQMGFEEIEILDALWLFNNNENLACDWLLNEHRPKSPELSIGIKRDTSFYNTLMDDPIIQLGLNKPKVFIAFLHLVEEPANGGKWVRDPVVSKVFHQLNKLYYLEKHSPDELVKIEEHPPPVPTTHSAALSSSSPCTSTMGTLV